MGDFTLKEQTNPITFQVCPLWCWNLMSKNMTNGVFVCADDCDGKPYYQDTDPTHLNYDGVETIVNKYIFYIT